MNRLLKYFEYAHLKPELQVVSKPIGELALKLDLALPESAEKTVGLRKLLEAKDCFVRAALDIPDAETKRILAEVLKEISGGGENGH